MTEKLKPCPFCGSRAKLRKLADGEWMAHCDKFDCGRGVRMEKISWREAEALSGKRLDRRLSYAATKDRQPTLWIDVIQSVVFVRWCYTDTCSGCHETIDGHSVWPETRDKNGVVLGGGCSECGYTGKCRHEEWYPVINALAGGE